LSAPLKVSGIGAAPRSALRVESSSRPPRATIARVGETFGLAVLFAFSLEAACRIEDWVEFRTPILARERSQEDLLVRDALGVHGRPGSHFQKWSLNALGMRGPEVSSVKPPHVLRVVTAGASETFGLYESPGREYPRQLEDTLNARVASIDTRCGAWHAQVLNAAMPGMSLPTIDQDIRLRVGPLNPDVILLYATPSVYLDDNVPVAARRDTLSHAVRPLPRRYALLPRVADRIRVQLKALLPTAVQDRIRRNQISAMLAQHPDNWRFDSVPADRLERFEADLRHAVGTIRSTGATPVLMTHANRFVGSSVSDVATLRAWEKFYPRASGQTIVAFDSVARLRTIAVARDSEAVLIDLTQTLARYRGAAFADYSHFTDLGAALAAATVTASILPASGNRLKMACESSRPGDCESKTHQCTRAARPDDPLPNPRDHSRSLLAVSR
jgi:hypothetical protein